MSTKHAGRRKAAQKSTAKPSRKKSSSARAPKKTRSDTYTAIERALAKATPKELAALRSKLSKGHRKVKGVQISSSEAKYLHKVLRAHKIKRPGPRPKIMGEMMARR